MDGDQIIVIICHKGILKYKTSKNVAQVLWLSDMMGSMRSLVIGNVWLEVNQKIWKININLYMGPKYFTNKLYYLNYVIVWFLLFTL